MSQPQDFNYLNSRAQKITEALYRVTDLFPEQEPLRWSLRQRAMEIFSKAIELKDAATHKKNRNLEEIIHNVSRILGFLELASASSFISQLNFEVLKREYLSLMDFIRDKKQEFLPKESLLLESVSNGQKPNEQKIMSNRMSIKKPPSTKSREEQIISAVNNKGWVGIKDIFSLFQGVSAKTIQRELSSLVEKGILKKAGEKRWRKYALN